MYYDMKFVFCQAKGGNWQGIRERKDLKIGEEMKERGMGNLKGRKGGKSLE